MKTLKVWGICQIEPPDLEYLLISHVILWICSHLLERKNSRLMVSLQISGVELSLDFVLQFSGFPLQHFESKSEAFLDEVSMTNRSLHVECQKRYPM